MRFLYENFTRVLFPRLYAYKGPRAQKAANVGAAYMLIEGFYGNTMQDLQFNTCELPVGPSSYSSYSSFPNLTGAGLNTAAYHYTVGHFTSTIWI